MNYQDSIITSPFDISILSKVHVECIIFHLKLFNILINLFKNEIHQNLVEEIVDDISIHLDVTL